jgi:hypothetical protein
MITRDSRRVPANPVHPGEVLLEDNELINGKRSVTAETAWLFVEVWVDTLSFGVERGHWREGDYVERIDYGSDADCIED